jgi:hypothetical protein
MKQNFDELVDKIVEKSGVKRSEVLEKIDAKLKQLSGLISKEGAAHIVANQLGIKLVESQASGKLQIKGIMTGLRDVEVLGKVMQIFPARQFQVQERTGQVGSLTIADETGSIRLVLWGDLCKHLENIKLGDIVKAKSAYVKDQNSNLELHLGTRGMLIINPAGETVGDVKFDAPATPAQRETVRKKLSELEDGHDNLEILGTIVQVFEPRFYEVCPMCSRRVLQKDGEFYCDTHNAVKPAYSYVVNLFLDDGTGNVRIVCFRNQALSVLNLKDEEIIKFKDNLDGFEAVRTAILGNITKFIGKSVRNKMFDRIEFIANVVDMNPDPEKEIELLNKQLAAQPSTTPNNTP